jgi:Zn-dependent peptidase ImmA (M78 family)
MELNMKRSRGRENYQPIYEVLVTALLDDLKAQYEISLKIISGHLSTLSGIVKTQYRKGLKEHKDAVKAYNDGLRGLKDVENAVKILDNIIKKVYGRKKV